ncbi:MAG: beta-L-arabinofuranosidase domain-containing protein [Planctomycetota bacterium]
MAGTARRILPALTVLLLVPLTALGADFTSPQPCAGLRAVPFNRVGIDDAFWSPRLDIVQKVTLPDMLDLAEKQGKIDNFAIVAGRKPGKIKLASCPDSDVYKLLEAAAYSLAWRRDPALETRVDNLIELIAAAQDKEGYLNTQYMLPLGHPASPPAEDPTVLRRGYGPTQRWKSTLASWPKGMGQMYCGGHLCEAAVAYYQATGKRAFLDVAVKFADHVYRRFPPGQPIDYADHPQIEIGLMRLFEATGDRRYLKLADHLARNVVFARPPDLGDGANRRPLAEQVKAWGHAVRINYTYSGATDVCRYLDQPDLRKALDGLWRSIVDRRIYVHGGVGGPADAEQLDDDWILDPVETYSECCANIAHGQWNHALNLLSADARYADIVELEAYNGGLAGINLDGHKFFYSNKLTVDCTEREDAHTGVRKRYLFCCPSKVPGFIAGISRWVAAQDDRDIYLNLYVGGTIKVKLASQTVTLHEETQYPWNGRVRIRVTPEKPGEFALALRIPGWAQGRLMPSDLYRFDKPETVKWTVTVNGVPISAALLEKGYLRVVRPWKAGDVVELTLPMPVRRVYSHANVAFTRGQTALYRGPMLYCLEGVDNPGFSVLNMVLPAGADFGLQRRADLLGNVIVLHGTGLADGKNAVEFTAIPYYAWQNRGIHEMTAWLVENPRILAERDAEGPMRVPNPANLATAGRLSASRRTTETSSLNGIRDGQVPKRSLDPTQPHLAWRPRKGGTEWVQCEFAQPKTVKGVRVFWFADYPGGEAKPPKSWRLLYSDGQVWKPVPKVSAYGVAPDKFNDVSFPPLKATVLRLEVELQPNFSGGIHEWVIEP